MPMLKNSYDDFDLLCGTSFYFEEIGPVKSPTLRDIRKITYKWFTIYLNILSMSLDKYLEMYGIGEQYRSLPEEEKQTIDLFSLMMAYDQATLFHILSFFIDGQITFDKETACFLITGPDSADPVGKIDRTNYGDFTEAVFTVLGIKKEPAKAASFKNERARQLAAKLDKGSMKKSQKPNKSYELANMIQKYCTHNKVGINILNVWDMTYYQFITMFNEYCSGRQADLNDAIAANTFSYSSASQYPASLWIEPLAKN